MRTITSGTCSRQPERPPRKRHPAAVKIKTYKVSRKEPQGLVICLPVLWARDVGIRRGDTLDLYRDENDRLIIVPPARKRGAA